MTDFQRFLMGLRADARLGRYIPDELVKQTPEVIVLTLIQSLATATEGHAPHPAMQLLERMEAR